MREPEHRSSANSVRLMEYMTDVADIKVQFDIRSLMNNNCTKDFIKLENKPYVIILTCSL